MNEENNNQNKQEQQNIEKLLRLNETGILNQAIRRPHSTSLRPFVEGKIITMLTKLKGSGLADSTLERIFLASAFPSKELQFGQSPRISSLPSRHEKL